MGSRADLFRIIVCTSVYDDIEYNTLFFFYKKLFYKKAILNIGKNLRKSQENSEAQNTVQSRNLRKYQDEIRQITQLDTNFINIYFPRRVFGLEF